MMSRRGFAGTSVAEIVEAAGVRAPALYWHFQNKAGVLTAVMERGATTWFSKLPSIATVPGETPGERLVAAMSAAGRAVSSNPQFLRLLILLSFERANSDVSTVAAIRSIRTRARAWLASLFLDGWPTLGDAVSGTLAARAMAFADGWCVMSMVEPEELDRVSFTWAAELLSREADRLTAEVARTVAVRTD